MAEILEFPTREAQAFSFLREPRDRLLRQKGAEDQLINYVVASLTDVNSKLQTDSACHFEARLPRHISGPEAETLRQDIAEGIVRLRRKHDDLTLKLAAQLVLAELRLFQHERQD